MSRTAEPRLPFADLMRASGCSSATVSGPTRPTRDFMGVDRTRDFDQGAPVTLLAELIGVSRRTLHVWKRQDVPLSAAENACDALGLHPCEVWADAYLDACARVS